MNDLAECSNALLDVYSGCKISKEMEDAERLISNQNDKEEKILKATYDKEKEDKEAVELRYKRLMHLLSKSQFYSQFLLDKIQSQQKNIQIQQKQNPRKKLKKGSDKENSSSVMNSDSENLSQNSSSGGSQKRASRKTKVDYQIKDVISEETVAAHMLNGINEDKDEPSFREHQPRLFENGELRPYQLDGFTWLKVLYEHGVNGILADEMGLGKTIQVIATICHLIDKGVPGPFLVVAPLSTLPNWLSEFERFSPQVPTILYHGSENERARLRSKFLKKHTVEGCKNGVSPVVVTSYEVIIRDQKFLYSILWRYLVVDEGHRIKNHKCQLARCLRAFNTSNRLLLTGTPLQNNLAELWSLLNFLLPEIFDSLDAFESWFEIGDMMEAGAEEKIVQQEREKQVVGTLHKILNPFLLRRVKADIDLNIPSKKELLVYTPMTPYQLDLYKATLTKDYSLFGEDTKNFEKKKNVNVDKNGRPIRSNKKTVDYSALCDDSESNCAFQKFLEMATQDYTKQESSKKIVAKSCVLNMTWRNTMMQCRKIVNHPYLLRYPLTSDGQFKVDQDLLTYCGKLQVLDQLLHELKYRGHKVLIFSQMAKLLDIIEDYLTMRPEFRYKRLDGSVKLNDRRTDIAEFNNNEDYFLFLLTTRAGGLGINLTSADTVIIYDSDWNPQQDLQAQDRCHRIGQTKPVLILRFITASTIDQRIVERAATKRKLEKMIMKKGQFTSGLLKNGEFEEVMDPEELLKLLQQRDHHRIHKASMGNGIYTKEEIDQLLNRGDFVLGSQTNGSMQLEGVFKVLPELDKKNSSLI